MVDRYYREIEDVKDNIENAMQISSILLKLKGYDNDLEKIDTNENNISSNLSKISDNENNISSNLEKINDNDINISDNLEKINDIKSLLPKSEIFKKTYNIKNQSFQFTRNIVYFKLLEIEIENNFNKDGKLEFDNYIYYRYDNLQLDHHRLQHEYRILDDKNNLLYKKILNKTNTSDLDFDKNVMLVKDNFYVTFKNNYNKIKIILDLYRVYRHGTGNFNLELINESFVKVSYLDKNDISLKIEDNENNISSNLSKISDNENNISSNLSKISDNENNISSNLSKISDNENNISSNLSKISNNSSDISSNLSKINNNENNISSNLSQISTNTGSISSNSGQINTNTSSIASNLSQINKITKTIMLKNIYFTDFDSKKDEVITRELLHFDNTSDRSKVATINYVNMKYNFKKDDFIEIDCKLMISHSSYDYAKNNLALYYDLYEGKNSDKNKLLFREIRRYNQFPLIINNDRIIAYNKICYKVKYDTSNIAFIVHMQAQNKKVHLIVYHYIIQNGVNYISVKHYGKS